MLFVTPAPFSPPANQEKLKRFNRRARCDDYDDDDDDD